MSDDLSLNSFTAIDDVGQVRTYIEALEAFDQISQLQELKQIERAQLRPGSNVLDVGCGFGLETQRLARIAGPGTTICGIDKSGQFIVEARRRAEAAGLSINYTVGSAEDLRFPDASFDHVRAERLLIYLDPVEPVLAQMRRVLRPGGTLASIEPDFETTTANVSDRSLLRRVMAHEADTAVAQSWLPGRLPALLNQLAFQTVAVATRIVILPQHLALEYLDGAARKAATAGVISENERDGWSREIGDLHARNQLCASVGYYLFTATR